MTRTGGNLLLVGNYPPGAGYAWWLMQRFWLELADLAADRGVRTFLAYPERGPVPGPIEQSMIEVIWHPIDTGGFRRILSSTRILRRHRITSVYFTDRSFFSPRYLAFRAAGVRSIINHDHTPGDRPRIKGIRRTAKRLRNRLPGMHVDRWIALSPLMRNRAIQNGCIPPERIVIVPNGITPITRRPGAASAVRSMFGLSRDAVIVVTVARAHPYKRIDFAVRLAHHLRVRGPDIPLTFLYIGSGPDLTRLKTLASDLGLGPRDILFAGHRDDVRAILPGCDVALHPSRGEGFSLAILEYLSAGLPVLVPDIPSVAQVIQPGRTGVVYPDDDVEVAGQLLLRVLHDEEQRKEMGEAGADFVRREHSLERACGILRSLVDETL